jgi:hypothetical protein
VFGRRGFHEEDSSIARMADVEESLRWVSLIIGSRADDSFKGADGGFGKPEYTIPDADDGDAAA